MDKVKLALAKLKKYHFWVLCVLIVLIGLLSWAWATQDLASQTEAHVKVLEGEVSGPRREFAARASQRPRHPGHSRRH